MMGDDYPLCTVPGCLHHGGLRPPVLDNRVGPHGEAVCTCHPKAVAEAAGVRRFDCSQTEPEEADQ